MQSIQHVGIIMDGNGRWAQNRLHPRIWGHVRGASVVSNIIEEADRQGVKSLTLYAFSTENKIRPKAEVETLFKLLKKFLTKEQARIFANRICFKVIGDISFLPTDTKNLIEQTEEKTKTADGLKLNFAFGYGGKQEIVDAVNNFINNYSGKMITAEDISSNLYNPSIPAVDLIIRTGGEKRLSNFLLWQSAYAEFYFTDTYWPDFDCTEFVSILNEVKQRERRFGGIKSKKGAEELSHV